MIKRPLNIRFRQAVLDGRKVTTIRDNPWPIGQPIMLYSWSGAAYRSKQDNLCAVMVDKTFPITIRREDNGQMTYWIIGGFGDFPAPLWQCEGFDSPEDMDSWFSSKMKPGDSTEKALMIFRLEGRES